MGTAGRDTPVRPTPQPPAWVRGGVLLLLPLVLLLVWWDGQRYDPGLVRFEKAGADPLVAKLPQKLGDLHRAGPVRAFRPETLFEYVNGHAEYYLGAGFKRLVTAEYGPPGKPALVVDLFDMGKGLHAFGVLMDEAGSDPTPLDLGEMGFSGTGGARFMAGPYYVRVTTFADGLDPVAPARVVAKGLAGEGGLTLAFRFPDFGPVLRTRFVKSNYRGLEFLTDVVEREFEGADGPFTAFLKTDGGEGAVGALTAFLQSDGIAFERKDLGGKGIAYLVEDPYEGPWFFVGVGKRLVGGFGPWTREREQAVMKDLSP